MINVTLPIFFEDKEDAELENLGIDNKKPLFRKKTQDVIFYSIDNVTEYEDKRRMYSEISSGGEYYICKYSVETVNELIIESFKEWKKL